MGWLPGALRRSSWKFHQAATGGVRGPMLNRLETYWSGALRKLTGGESALAGLQETTMKLWQSLCARRCPVIFS